MNRVTRSSFLLLLFFIFTPSAEAALLYISPADGTYTQGDKINIQIYASSQVSLNAVSGTISFSTKLFTVESISKSGSIMSFWAEEPSFSNSKGSISFEGVSPGQGYEGSRGKVLSITLRALRPGKGELTFTGGSILANDGMGTNILASFGDAEFTIRAPAPLPAVSTSTPEAEIIVETGPPEPPIIEKYKSEITPSEFFRVEGSTIYPDVEIIFQIEPERGEVIHESTQAFSSGKFIFTLSRPLQSGVYKVSAVIKNEKGVKSDPSKTIVVSVKPPPWVTWGNEIIQILSIAVPLLALCVLIFVFIRRQLRKAARPKRAFEKIASYVDGDTRKTFNLFRDYIGVKIRLIEKIKGPGAITSKKEKMLENLEKNLSETEAFLAKEIEDIDEK